MEINITTYRNALETIEKIEIEEEKFRRNRFYFLMVCFVISTITLVVYIFIKDNAKPLFSMDLLKVALSPIFSYLFASYEKDYINQRRSEIIKSIKESFTKDSNLYQFRDGPQDINEIKKIINDLLKSKLNG